MNMLSFHPSAPRARQAKPTDMVRSVQAVLCAPEEELDYAASKVALDLLIDPAADAGWTLSEVDRLTASARRLAGPNPAEQDKLRAVRTVIYESGPWNGFRPFAYDHSEGGAWHMPNKLLHNYLKNRLGQCVSMPILFLILGDRLGLNLALACSPNHFFVRYTAPGGQVWNLETTSGADPARVEWFQQNMPMTDRALETGYYMRSLPRREAIAMMATTVCEQLGADRRWSELAAVSELILEISPRSPALIQASSAYGRILQAEFEDKYPIPFLTPQHLLWRRLMLMERNNSLIAAAEHLGWQPSEFDLEQRRTRCS
jgi:regulator of sirC expression with transglutaminase-like and TPR domain